MSYVRTGDDSDVHLIGTTADGAHVIECCGCLLTRDMRRFAVGEEPQWVLDLPGWAQGLEWDFGPVQHFTAASDALAHLAGHLRTSQDAPDFRPGRNGARGRLPR